MVANNVLELSSISAWKEGKLQLQKRPLIKVRPFFFPSSALPIKSKRNKHII